MDIKKLQSILISGGIRIADDDPVFTLVALNEAMLADMTRLHQQSLTVEKVKQFSGNQAAIIVTAICSLAIGVAIGSTEKYIILIGFVGSLLGYLLGFVSTLYFQKHVTQNLAVPISKPISPEILSEQTIWTDDEFQQVAITTNLSIRTLSACRDVLVGGMSCTNSAELHKVLPLQISQGLKLFRNKK